jgi:nitroreductase
MENMWLMAESLGIGFHIVSVFSAESVEEELQGILGIPSHMKIGFACRLGYPAAEPQTYTRVRRDLNKFVLQNHFGERLVG